MIHDANDRTNNSHSLANNFRTNTPFLFSFSLLLAYGIIFLIGLFANIFVIIVIMKCRRMRTLTNRFLLNLAISDLLATLICLPPTAYHHYEKRWIFGELLCRFVPFIQGIVFRPTENRMTCARLRMLSNLTRKLRSDAQRN